MTFVTREVLGACHQGTSPEEVGCGKAFADLDYENP